jgi:truncated hemoglobin YjbI
MLNRFFDLSTTTQLLWILVVLVAAVLVVVVPVYLGDRLSAREARRTAADPGPAPQPEPAHTPQEVVAMTDPTLAHPAGPPTLYDRLTQNGTDVGVFATVTTMQINRLLGPVGSDPELQGDAELLPYFRRPGGELVNRARLERHVTAFLMEALGGPRSYSGRAMEAAHAPGHRGRAPTMPITDAAFDRFVGHVGDVLTELGVPRDWIAEVGATVEPLRAAIVQDRTPGQS